MLIHLKGARVIDPYHQRDEIADLGSKTAASSGPPSGPPARWRRMTYLGKIVMAGAIDIHSHIAGGNVNTARLLVA